MIDLETGVRGFVITREERFLRPWDAARAAFPEQARLLVSFADDPEQAEQLRRIARAGISYIREYSVPLVNAARRNEPSARSVAATAEGKRRVDALRATFDRITETERDLLTARQHSADVDARRATVAGAVGLAGSVVLILLFAGYLTRVIGRPVRRAAVMSGRLAGGDLSVRLTETGVGEIGELERAFNTMGSSLEASRDELRQLADEQAALRRVATLVTQTGAPFEVFETVTREVGLLFGADLAGMGRFEEARAQGIRSSVGCPIVVEGRLWGVIAASSKREGPFPAGTESQIAEFTELVATAIANAESRAALLASRARVVLRPYPRRSAGGHRVAGVADLAAGRRGRYWRAVSSRDRGDRLLHRERGFDERGQALRRRHGRSQGPRGGRRAESRSATTEREAPGSTRERGCSDCTTGWLRSMAGSR